MSDRYTLVADRAGHRCEYCRAPEAIFNFPFEVEHVIPVSQDGGNEESNMALACRSCNLFKLDHLTGMDPESNQEVGLYQPRRNHWDEHFHIDRESGLIEGLTAPGRATISRMRMNSVPQMAARQAWMKLGLFP